jgi:hypothetical protein
MALMSYVQRRRSGVTADLEAMLAENLTPADTMSQRIGGPLLERVPHVTLCA